MQASHCPFGYFLNDKLICEHELFPPSFMIILGSIIIAIVGGLSSLAGLGGGGPTLVVLIMFLNYLPKDASIVVFVTTLGSTLGHCINQMSKAHNGQPIIQYKYAFVSLPIMFVGSYFGVYLNNFLPSLVICGIIVYQTIVTLPKIHHRAKQSHEKQSKQLLLHQEKNTQQDLIKVQKIDPFQTPRNIFIFKKLLLIMTIFTVFMSLKGSKKFPSLIGIKGCSFQYWSILVLSLIILVGFAYNNLNTLKMWIIQDNKHSVQLKYIENGTKQIPQIYSQNIQSEDVNLVEKNLNNIIYYSLKAGVFSGFGLGGGLFLVPLYRIVGCQPLQATATTSFTIVITAAINCIQGILLGVISLQQFFYLVTISATVSYFISVIVSEKLRKINRFSYIEYLLYILLILTAINIPLSLFMKYIDSGYDSSLILSFGDSC